MRSEKRKLVDFYDTDVIANDDFLTKYLAKNKEIVLGEIIATIQKEQNEIIRDTPWHSVIVQGVAGSGKTTVAMHRISYILYNYPEKFRPEQFFCHWQQLHAVALYHRCTAYVGSGSCTGHDDDRIPGEYPGSGLEETEKEDALWIRFPYARRA